MDKTHIIALGPESSGKSSLIHYLSDKFGLPFVPEYAREYLNKLNRKYVYEDLKQIALHQEQVAQSIESRIVLSDTDIITILVWQAFAFPNEGDIITPLLANYNFSYRHYFVCYPDLDWVDDPLREHPNLEDRKKIFQANIELLTSLGAEFTVLKGFGESRYTLASELVNQLQAS